MVEYIGCMTDDSFALWSLSHEYPALDWSAPLRVPGGYLSFVDRVQFRRTEDVDKDDPEE